jgi:hypothetical protein
MKFFVWISVFILCVRHWKLLPPSADHIQCPTHSIHKEIHTQEKLRVNKLFLFPQHVLKKLSLQLSVFNLSESLMLILYDRNMLD